MCIFMIITALSLLICFYPMQCSNHQRRSSGPHAAKIDKMIHTYLKKNWNNIQDTYVLDYISDNNGYPLANLRGNANVANLRENSNQANLRDHANEANLRGNANVANLRENANQANLRDNANEANLRENSNQANLRDHANVANLRENANQTNLRENANEANLRDNANDRNLGYVLPSRRRYVGNKENITFYVNIAFDLMEQSIYATRYRLRESDFYRQKYQNDPLYKIGYLYGNVLELAGKIEHMFAQLNRFLNITGRVHFLWFLILYEKCLAAHVDLTTAVERIFQYQVEYEAVSKKPENSEENEAP